MITAGDRMILAKMRAEKKIDADMQAQIEKVFTLLDPYELDISYPLFEAAFLQVIEHSASKFMNIEAVFLKAYCTAEFGIDVATASTVQDLIGWDLRDQISNSVKVVTSSSIKSHTAKAQSIEKAYTDARTRAIGVGKRHARTKARELTTRTTRDTKGLKGYKRVLTGNETCDFCKMLAGRGAVYDAETVKFLSHDACDCVGVPQAGGPEPTMDQKYFASPRKEKKADGDSERLKEALKVVEA